MQKIVYIPNQLKLRLLPNRSIDSNAVFQFIIEGTDELCIQINDDCCIQFSAFYKYENEFYPHPFNLYTNINDRPVFQCQGKRIYTIPLFLQLKRLRDFNEIDWKNYYRIIDENLGITGNFSDFHDIYLKIFYRYNNTNQWIEYLCNNELPIHLPKFISNPWTTADTLFRFRYDAEQRDGVFTCQMKLLDDDIGNISSYKIVLCLITNTIPARMDFHSIRWICKLKQKSITRRGRSSSTQEDSYNLNHSTGIIVAEISGLDILFSPRIQLDQIRSCFEPENFQEKLENSIIKECNSLTIGVIKEKDYPKIIKLRQTNKIIQKYIPFNELDGMNNYLESTDQQIIKCLKDYKKNCYKQLSLYDKTEKKTYSQAHVRLYVAAYDKNDILLTETLYPPLRDIKKFEQLQIIKIIQEKFELHSGHKAFIYCIYDSDKLKSDLKICPYIIEFAFSSINFMPNLEQLIDMFEKQNINTQASYDNECTNLLEFTIPNVPMYNKYRVFIRLQHKFSLDYDPSKPALIGNQHWIYYADTRSITDNYIAEVLTDSNGARMNNYDENMNTPIFQIGPL